MSRGPTENGRCPRCKSAPALAAGFGAIREDVCGTCQGRFVTPDGVERVIHDELGMSRALLRELMALFAAKERIVCPACASKMSPVHVRSVRIDVCTGCGGAWFDAGELAKLTDGRYVEVSPATAPTVDAAASASASALSPAAPGRLTVFLASIESVSKQALSQAFAICPGLTEQDAAALARSNHGVVIDGVSEATAKHVVGALSKSGIEAGYADSAWATLPFASTTHAFAPLIDGLKVTRENPDVIGSTDFTWQQIASMCVGHVKRSALTKSGSISLESVNDGTIGNESEFVVVENDDVILDVVQMNPPRRVRVHLSSVIFDASSPSKKTRAETFRARIAQAATLASQSRAPFPMGRGVRACVDGRELPRYRSMRDLERESAWLLWRHHGPGVVF